MRTLEIRKPTWCWQYCNQSGWSFQIGHPHLNMRRSINHYQKGSGRVDRTRIDGEMSVHVFYAKWWIVGSDWVKTNFDDPQDRIELCMARMDGINIIGIDLHVDGWITTMRFDAKIVITCEPYPDSEHDNIANLIYNDAQLQSCEEPCRRRP